MPSALLRFLADQQGKAAAKEKQEKEQKKKKKEKHMKKKEKNAAGGGKTEKPMSRSERRIWARYWRYEGY